jgi:hypothetical protein
VSPKATCQGPQRTNRAKPITGRHQRLEAGDLEEEVERRLAHGRLHVAATDSCTSEAVTRCNSIDYLLTVYSIVGVDC